MFLIRVPIKNLRHAKNYAGQVGKYIVNNNNNKNYKKNKK